MVVKRDDVLGGNQDFIGVNRAIHAAPENAVAGYASALFVEHDAACLRVANLGQVAAYSVGLYALQTKPARILA